MPEQYKTPGVETEEISTIAPSVAEVATAIPAFVGYTLENRVSPQGPKRIRSLAEFEQYFGGAYIPERIDFPNWTPEKSDELEFEVPKLLLWHCMQMYFANGGGPCWVNAIKIHRNNHSLTIDESVLGEHLSAFEKISEPTLLVIPDAVNLADEKRKALYDAMLQQCKNQKDRFCIFDACGFSEHIASTHSEVNLRAYLPAGAAASYGGAYYPWINCSPRMYGSLSPSYSEDEHSWTVEDITTLKSTRQRAQEKLEQAEKIEKEAIARYDRAQEESKKAEDIVNEKTTKRDAQQQVMEQAIAEWKNSPGDTSLENKKRDSIRDFLKAHDELEQAEIDKAKADIDVTEAKTAKEEAIRIKTEATSAIPKETAPQEGTDKQAPTYYLTKVKMSELETTTGTSSEDQAKLWRHVQNIRVCLPPSAAIAGVYASVDRDRGVWKAPANVPLRGVIAPAVETSKKEHGEFNVDSVGGKSINVIRSNASGDVMVLGARTLDGNSNEWRYVSTRRFFLMVEESIANAIQWAVFEPNDANTWARVQSTIENFLTQKWREGALFGASPSDAFSVSIGLGRTMTSDDILNGVMNVRISMRVVTPAEVVVLKFSHKLFK